MDSNLKLFEMGESTRSLARCVPCSELTAMVLQMMQQGGVMDIADAQDWMNPKFERLLDSVPPAPSRGTSGTPKAPLGTC